MKKQIHFIVCSHGFGHIKRTLEITNRILQYSSCRVTIHVNKDHFKQFSSFVSSWISGCDFNEIHFETKYMDQAPDYKLSNSTYSIKNYEDWIDDLKNINLDSNDIMVSDNSVGPFMFNKQTILIGSFLWVSINKLRHSNWDEILEVERSILDTQKPVMFGLDTMVMDEVKTLTKFEGLPWFCSRNHNSVIDIKTNEKTLLVSAGGTSDSYEVFHKVVVLLLTHSQIKIYVDRGLMLYLGGVGINLPNFDYKVVSFLKLTGIVARPGIGILTDCVKYGIPIFCISETDQQEMEHNSSIIQKKNFGLNLYHSSPEQCVTEIVKLIHDNSRLNEMRNNLLNEKVEGVETLISKLTA